MEGVTARLVAAVIVMVPLCMGRSSTLQSGETALKLVQPDGRLLGRVKGEAHTELGLRGLEQDMLGATVKLLTHMHRTRLCHGIQRLHLLVGAVNIDVQRVQVELEVELDPLTLLAREHVGHATMALLLRLLASSGEEATIVRNDIEPHGSMLGAKVMEDGNCALVQCSSETRIVLSCDTVDGIGSATPMHMLRQCLSLMRRQQEAHQAIYKLLPLALVHISEQSAPHAHKLCLEQRTTGEE